MKLKRLNISNYKSIKEVEVIPADLSVFIGPNASGKSNFTDALDFLGAVYRDGLESAVALKGGYDNIAFRKVRRSKSPIYFNVEVELTSYEAKRFMARLARFASSRVINKLPPPSRMTFRHSFSFKTMERNITSDFEIEDESLEFSIFHKYTNDLGRRWISIRRKKAGGIQVASSDDYKPFADYILERMSTYELLNPIEEILSKQDLFISEGLLGKVWFSDFLSWLSEISVHRVAPEICREAGVPSPNPEVSASGKNLPAIVDWLSRKHPKSWAAVLHSMSDIVPTIEDIKTEYLHTRTLGLFFKEENVGRYWSSHEVSDGTLQTLALLVALADPRKSVVIIEEPENSVHPWILRGLVNNFKESAKKKNILITTHSPTLIDMMTPETIYVVNRVDGETEIEKLIDIDPSIESGWRKGDYRISDYLDSGLVPKAVPGEI